MSFIKYSIFLFLITFFFFNLNLNALGSGDTIPARLLPINILSGQGLYFDNYVNFLQNKYQTTYYFQQFNGHYVSSFPIITGLVALPFYAPFYVLLNLNSISDMNTLFNIASALQKFASSSLASLSVVLFFILIRKISGNNKVSMIFALIFAFATQTFSISAQALWQHGTANLFMIISQIFLIKAFKSNYLKGKWFYLLSLTFAILSFWSRPVFLIYLMILFLIVILKNKKDIILYFSLTLFGILILIGYNTYFFHSLFGGYGNQTGTFNANFFFSRLFGIFFSPARGIIFYTPLYIISLVSIIFFKQIKHILLSDKIIYYLNYLYILLGLIFYGFWVIWWGGHSWGDRLLTDLTVSASILMYFFYKFIVNKILKIILFIFIVYSIAIQSIGVFCYINSRWDVTPLNVDTHPERLWDFTDNPISRSIKAGPDLRRFYPIFSEWRLSF